MQHLQTSHRVFIGVKLKEDTILFYDVTGLLVNNGNIDRGLIVTLVFFADVGVILAGIILSRAASAAAAVLFGLHIGTIGYIISYICCRLNVIRSVVGGYLIVKRTVRIVTVIKLSYIQQKQHKDKQDNQQHSRHYIGRRFPVAFLAEITFFSSSHINYSL